MRLGRREGGKGGGSEAREEGARLRRSLGRRE